MSLLLIAWRSFQQRSVASTLTTVSLALGIGMTILVLALYGMIVESFQRNASVGCNLIVGAKGSPLQLTLNTVYYLSKPVENIPYDFYLEFLSAEERRRQLNDFGGRLVEPDRKGKFHQYVAGGIIVPVALGDYFDSFRVVGTTPDMFDKMKWGPSVDRPYKFKAGRNFVAHSAENSFFEAVVGARVAEQMKVGVGDRIYPKHGDPEGMGHREYFTIVGVLDSTGTPNDRAAFVNLEGFFLMDGHARPLEKFSPSSPGTVEEVSQPRVSGALRLDQREVTAILLRTVEQTYALPMMNIINEGRDAQAAAPVGEIAGLMQIIVTPINWVLWSLTVLTCLVAAVGILVSIYNSMNERRRDIAVMRALGARQDTVMWVILAESGLIAVLGGILGWVFAHGLIAVCSGMIERHTGINVGFFSFTKEELWIIPIVLILAGLAGSLPAIVAYRTDVGRHLQ